MELVDELPGVYLIAAEHASNGEFTFIRWVMHATGEHGITIVVVDPVLSRLVAIARDTRAEPLGRFTR